MTDIANIKPVERVVDILHPATKELLGVRVSLVSFDDERMKRVKRNITDRRLSLDAKGKNFKAEEMEDNTNSLLFSAMTGWEWYEVVDDKGRVTAEQPTFNGEVPPFNRGKVIQVFTELPWFRFQIDEAIGDDQAFFVHSK